MASGPAQRFTLSAWRGSERTAAETHSAFVAAWQQQRYAQLWQFLSESARQQAFAELAGRLSGERFSPEQLRLLLEQGHPLSGDLLWSLQDPRARPWPLVETAWGWRIGWP